jgi:HD-like signal output (HDOD) protein
MKRILFVDDEAALLDGLRARLRCLRSSWEMVFVESGSRAITEIEHRPFDVVISDVRMPGMDGTQLLNTVAERWPQTWRIVLSGCAEEEKIAGLLAVAHQHLSKPCDAAQLETAIVRCFPLHELLQEPRLRALVGRVRRLPTIPRVYSQLRAAMSCEDTSVAQIADIVGTDPIIAAKVLQIANSSFFRPARRIARLDQAINYLGLATVRNLVMSVEIFADWHGATIPGLDADTLQAKALQLAASARSLASGHAFADEAMLAGLLHNIGYRVLTKECPEELLGAASLASQRGLPLHVAEREVIGASYAEIGAYLLGIWGLPHAVVEAVAFQHGPRRLHHAQFNVVGAVAIAYATLNAEPTAASGAGESMNDQLLQTLHAPYDWKEAQRLVSQAPESRSHE